MKIVQCDVCETQVMNEEVRWIQLALPAEMLSDDYLDIADNETILVLDICSVRCLQQIPDEPKAAEALGMDQAVKITRADPKPMSEYAQTPHFIPASESDVEAATGVRRKV